MAGFEAERLGWIPLFLFSKSSSTPFDNSGIYQHQIHVITMCISNMSSSYLDFFRLGTLTSLWISNSFFPFTFGNLPHISFYLYSWRCLVFSFSLRFACRFLPESFWLIYFSIRSSNLRLSTYMWDLFGHGFYHFWCPNQLRKICTCSPGWHLLYLLNYILDDTENACKKNYC